MKKTIAGTFAAQDGRVLACVELSLGGPDLSAGQSAFEKAAAFGTYQAAVAGALGNDARVEFHLRASQPRHSAIRIFPFCI
jgi:hypothetical protein